MAAPARSRSEGPDAAPALRKAAVAIARALSRDAATVPAAFTELLRGPFLPLSVSHDLRLLLAGKPREQHDVPPGELRLWTSADLRLRTRITAVGAAPPSTITTVVRTTLVGNAGRSACTLRMWRSSHCTNDVFDPAARIEPTADVSLEPGEAVVLRAGVDAYHATARARPAITLIAAGPATVPLAWRYDVATRRPIRAEPAYKEWLRLREAISFADILSERTLVPSLAGLADHPSHFIRWAAVKTVHRMAPERGRPLLQTLASDPHPQVRTAARFLLAGTDAR